MIRGFISIWKMKRNWVSLCGWITRLLRFPKSAHIIIGCRGIFPRNFVSFYPILKSRLFFRRKLRYIRARLRISGPLCRFWFRQLETPLVRNYVSNILDVWAPPFGATIFNLFSIGVQSDSPYLTPIRKKRPLGVKYFVFSDLTRKNNVSFCKNRPSI